MWSQDRVSPRRYESPTRDAAAEETRQRIVNAAGEILAGPKGFAGMSLDAVAKVAGVTRLTIYNQFGTRRGLLEAVFDERARQGGLTAIPAAMALPRPKAAVLRIAEIFCAFWASDASGLAQVWAATIGDPELSEGIKARNERRRAIFRTLVTRMVERGEIQKARASDLIDLLHALTSLPFYLELSAPSRSAEAIAYIIRETVEGALLWARMQN
jgi:AcrR family transcriptional regulator